VEDVGSFRTVQFKDFAQHVRKPRFAVEAGQHPKHASDLMLLAKIAFQACSFNKGSGSGDRCNGTFNNRRFDQ
jgi:hypothetical protein